MTSLFSLSEKLVMARFKPVRLDHVNRRLGRKTEPFVRINFYLTFKLEVSSLHCYDHLECVVKSTKRSANLMVILCVCLCLSPFSSFLLPSLPPSSGSLASTRQWSPKRKVPSFTSFLEIPLFFFFFYGSGVHIKLLQRKTGRGDAESQPRSEY